MGRISKTTHSCAQPPKLFTIATDMSEFIDLSGNREYQKLVRKLFREPWQKRAKRFLRRIFRKKKENKGEYFEKP